MSRCCSREELRGGGRSVPRRAGGAAARGADLSRSASVASFFVSRIDTAVDALIDAGSNAHRPARRAACAACWARRRSPTPSWPTRAFQEICRENAGRRLPTSGAQVAAAALGQHQYEGSRLPRRAVRRGTDRPGNREHYAAGDHGCLPRPRAAAPQLGRGHQRRGHCHGRAWPRSASRSTRLPISCSTTECGCLPMPSTACWRRSRRSGRRQWAATRDIEPIGWWPDG